MISLYQTFLFLIFAATTLGAELHFNRDIKPILSDRCFQCHGPDSASRKAKLRLDDPQSAFGPRKDPTQHAIVAGHPEQSVLVQRVLSTDPDEVMPPESSHLKLTAAEKETLQEWIKQGAKYEPHWAFIPPPVSVAVPAVKNSQWPRSEIDRFILARLEAEGLTPSPEANKTRWLRRVTYDLTGLPPTPAQVDAFLADDSRSAYENVVEQLLASPRFGERMAVMWLDGARYADSYGYQSDLLSPTWPYRDWVVDAYNRNLPYDRFVTEQLAGDLLPNPTRQQRLATAFNRLHRQTNEGGSVSEEWRNEYVSDRTQTFGSVFLGLTFECSRCHDHKFDPITQRDYYSLSAFFNSIDEHGLYDNTPRVPTPSILLPTPEQEAAMNSTARERERSEKDLQEAMRASGMDFEKWLRQTNLEPVIPDLIAHFAFDVLTQTNLIQNEVNSTNTAGPINRNTLAEGKTGQAIQFTGDDSLKVVGIFKELEPWRQYTIAFWLKIPEALTNAIIFHCTQGSDTSYHGTECSIQDGRLFFVIKRFWPGNAIAIQTRNPIPAAKWVHVTLTYDGSANATGMNIILDGETAPLEILRNNLFKSPENADFTLNFGERSRSPGLKEALLDDLRIYNRALAPIEAAQIFDGRALADTIATRNVEKLRPYYLSAISKKIAKGRDVRAAAVKSFFLARNAIQETSVMEELAEPRPAFVLRRGDYDAPKNDSTRVERGTPAFLPPFPPKAPRNRGGLAQWLMDPNHPLTSRVAVNRYWHTLFGRGLVTTVDNFGSQGAAPTHADLLDWLARDFINSGWDTKALLKKIVLSATYRQDSIASPELRRRDPENLLLARGPSQRLPAEMIRDTALAAAGLLDSKLGGPPVSPYSPGDLWRESNTMSPRYKQSVGGDLYRRSLYTVIKRTAPMPDMIAFDAPSREVCLLKRSQTGTPQQAFVLLNDPQFVEAARVLAEKALADAPTDPKRRIRSEFRLATGRTPSKKEIELLSDLLQSQKQLFQAEPERAARLINVGDRKTSASLNPVELAAETAIVQAILNLDASIWKR